MITNILWFEDLSINDVESVGGKNASLGEMYTALKSADILIPNGFATTAAAFKQFLDHNQIEQHINDLLIDLDVNDLKKLTATGKTIRQMVLDAELPSTLVKDIRETLDKLYLEMGSATDATVAVRSSATAEDLPEASFAGQQETFLNVKGINEVLDCVKKVFASLYNDRAIAYRVHQGFEHSKIAISVGIQVMVRSDLASSGVMFTIDTESGFKDCVFITSAYGLGESIVQGSVNPDEFYVYKPNIINQKPAILQRKLGSKLIKMVYTEKGSTDYVKTVDVPKHEQLKFSLSNQDIEQLAKQAIAIENHYGRPMDIEWAKDGNNNKLYIVQARPETIQSRTHEHQFERYQLSQRGEIIAEGRSVGQRIATGVARIVADISEMDKIQPGEVLVTDMTDPDWEPVMKHAAAIVTNRGGRTCHAAIIAREFKVPAVVGCNNATDSINDGDTVTVSCAEGDTGYVYAGKLKYQVTETNLEKIPELPIKMMMNVGNPERAFSFSNIPNDGVGLARLEFIISNTIGIHPQALLEFDQLPQELANEISEKIGGYATPIDYYIDRLTEGVATIGAAFYPKPVIVRLSDFKTNEYRNLLGGQRYEPQEENPMLGFRGAARYVSDSFDAAFELECKAIRKVRDQMSLKNIQVMIPFVRTVSQAAAVIQTLKKYGLERGKNDLKIIMMCEIPSNAILVEEFLQYFDGFSIGSNDLTQLTLGVDRDSGLVANDFDERDGAVKMLIKNVIKTCRDNNKYVGICGQGPSDYPDFAEWLVKENISSISLVPDTVIEMLQYLAK